MNQPTAAVLVAALVACGTGGGDRAAVVDSAVSIVPVDSLAVAGRDVEIWFTLSRPGLASDGTPCTDRAIEVRRGGRRIPVPLLYTRETPRIVNDSTARAVLYTDCLPGDAYLVDLRTGRPTREQR